MCKILFSILLCAARSLRRLRIWFLWFPPHANVSCLPYILGPASGMVIALEEICA